MKMGLESHVNRVIEEKDISLYKYLCWNGGLYVSDKEIAEKIMTIQDDSGEFGKTRYDENSKRIYFEIYKTFLNTDLNWPNREEREITCSKTPLESQRLSASERWKEYRTRKNENEEGITMTPKLKLVAGPARVSARLLTLEEIKDLGLEDLKTPFSYGLVTSIDWDFKHTTEGIIIIFDINNAIRVNEGTYVLEERMVLCKFVERTTAEGDFFKGFRE
jgi:hypothetical protein